MLALVEQARQLAAPARAATIARASDAPAPTEPTLLVGAAGLIAWLKRGAMGRYWPPERAAYYESEQTTNGKPTQTTNEQNARGLLVRYHVARHQEGLNYTRI
jgi:hypothetical protein